MTYEEAMKAVVSKQEAKREVERHGLEFNTFIQEVGDRPRYKGSTILNWLGY